MQIQQISALVGPRRSQHSPIPNLLAEDPPTEDACGTAWLPRRLPPISIGTPIAAALPASLENAMEVTQVAVLPPTPVQTLGRTSWELAARQPLVPTVRNLQPKASRSR